MGDIGLSYKRFVDCARGLNGFVVGQKEDVPYDITELANGYCKACDENNEIKKSQYISALMVRYWHMVVLTYNQSQFTRLDFEDIISWIYDAFEKAFKYRSWLDTSKAISKDPKGAEKVINRCIYSITNYWYNNFNKDKRKINFLASSLDEYLPGEDSDSGITVLDTVSDSGDDTYVDDCRSVVQYYINKEDLIKAIIVDVILYQESFVDYEVSEKGGIDEDGEEIVYTRSINRFSPIKTVQTLKNLNTNYIKYFIDNYDVNYCELEETINFLHKKCNSTLHIYLDKTIEDVKNNREILDLLCM